MLTDKCERSVKAFVRFGEPSWTNAYEWVSLRVVQYCPLRVRCDLPAPPAGDARQRFGNCLRQPLC